MALNIARLKQKIVDVMMEIRTETDDPDNSMNEFAQELATAIVEEIKQITIIAIAPSGGGPVTIETVE